MPATNRLPQVPNVVVTYVGDLEIDKWVSLVDSTLNNDNPCVQASVAAGAQDSTHSGPIQASNATKEIIIPQGTLLDETKTFAVCYAETDGTALDATWRDSYIRFMISKLESLSSHAIWDGTRQQSISHYTDGQIARVGGTKDVWDGSQYVSAEVADLELTYTGSLASNKYVSLVDETFNGDFPCADSNVAAAGYDSLHSGVDQGSSSVVAFDTKDLSTSNRFAVCYSEGDGTSSAAWVDSGIRLTVSKITEVLYGYSPTSLPATTTYPQRTFRSTNVMAATNRLPQVANTVITYVGDLGASRWVSLVDSTLNAANPCVSSAVAAATADAEHSGPIQADGSKELSIPQSTLLKVDSDNHVGFALCYADTNGTTTDTTWRDSYIRVKVSKLESIYSTMFDAETTHRVTQYTDGQIARVGGTELVWNGDEYVSSNIANLELTYTGSLASHKWVSLVDDTLNDNFPCEWQLPVDATPSSFEASLAADGAHSGISKAGSATSAFELYTRDMSLATFAVCYTEALGEFRPEFHMKFEDSHFSLTDIAFDSSENAITAAATDVTKYAGYLSDYAANFEFITSKILLSSPISISDGIYTISTWTRFPLPHTTRVRQSGFQSLRQIEAVGGYKTLLRGQNGDHQVIVNLYGKLGMYCSGACEGRAGFHSSGYDITSLAADWYHLVAVANGTHTKFFVNSVLVGAVDVVSKTDVYCIGNWQNGAQPWGIIDDLRVFKIAVPDNRISELAGKPLNAFLFACCMLTRIESTQPHSADCCCNCRVRKYSIKLDFLTCV